MAKIKKTEHAGPKNGGGHWGSRAEAKTLSKKARRKTSKKIVKKFKYRSADKQVGPLISGINGEPFYFRIYGKNGKEFYLDYSRKVLGHEAK